MLSHRVVFPVIAVGLLTGCGTGGHRAPPKTAAQTTRTAPSASGARRTTPLPPGVFTQTIVRRLSPTHFQLTVTNLSGYGFIDGFTWATGDAPIKAVTGSTVGVCSLLRGAISCRSIDLRPPSCTCKGDGGHITVDFVTRAGPAELPRHNRPLSAGGLTIDSVTPTLLSIPSSERPMPPPANAPCGHQRSERRVVRRRASSASQPDPLAARAGRLLPAAKMRSIVGDRRA